MILKNDYSIFCSYSSSGTHYILKEVEKEKATKIGKPTSSTYDTPKI